MTSLKTPEEILAIYESVSSTDGLLYHVAHARKENSDKEYDGEELIAIAKDRVEADVRKLEAVREFFKARSLHRDP